MGGGYSTSPPSRVKNFVDCLIYVSKDYIPNLRPLGHIVHVEKFVVGGVGGGSEQYVLTVILVLSLRPKVNNNKHKFVQKVAKEKILLKYCKDIV